MEIFHISKSDHTIMGVVYCCFCEDSQKDILEDISVLKTAARNFMLRYSRGENVFNIDHSDKKILKGIDIVENFVTDEPTLKKGVEIPPGCWVLSLRIPEKLWPELSSAQGFSMQGEGSGEPR